MTIVEIHKTIHMLKKNTPTKGAIFVPERRPTLHRAVLNTNTYVIKHRFKCIYLLLLLTDIIMTDIIRFL